MFTGIVEEIGIVKAVKKGSKSSTLTIEGSKIFQDLKIGDSVSTNGVCLTATSISNNSYTADVMNVTLSNSNLGELRVGSRVNLERAMSAQGRFGGHIVSGHIDGVGKIMEIRKDDIATWYKISADKSILKYIVEKGSIAIDGISLTVAKVNDNNFSVSIIPHTGAETILSQKSLGEKVNLEVDIVGKYIEKLMSSSSNITREFLIENGF